MATQSLEQALEAIHQMEFEQARQTLKTLLKDQPNDADILHLMGFCELRLGHHVQAIGWLEKALKYDSHNTQIYANLGLAYMTAGQLHQGMTQFNQALALSPEDVMTHLYMGNTALSIQAHAEAVHHYDRVLKVEPEHMSALSGKIQCLTELGHLEQAQSLLEKLGDISSLNPDVYACYGRIFMKQHRYDASIEAFKNVIQLVQDNPIAYENLAIAYEISGDNEQAQSYYLKALNLAPHLPQSIFALVRMKASAVKPYLKHIKTLVAQHQNALPPQLLKSYYFALGEHANIEKHYLKAIRYFKKAGKAHPVFYDREEVERQFKSLKQFFNLNYFKTLPESGDTSDSPVFIVGMPRSGSTLLESILDTQKEISCIGEYYLMPQIMRNFSGLIKSPKPYPDSLTDLSGEKAHQLGQFYIEKAQTEFNTDLRIVDKALNNFKNLGLIYTLLPHAKILHTTRSPIDIAVSCLGLDFKGQFPWSYQQDDFIHYYLQYQDLMQHWKSVLPNVFLDISYEKMVSQAEQESQKLFAFLDLAWHPDVLCFYQQKRGVQTASRQQVNQPIYQHAQRKWKRYEAEIPELIQAFPEWLI